MLCATQNDLNQLSHVRRMYAETQDHRHSSMRYDNGLKQHLIYTYINILKFRKKFQFSLENWNFFWQLALLE